MTLPVPRRLPSSLWVALGNLPTCRVRSASCMPVLHPIMLSPRHARNMDAIINMEALLKLRHAHGTSTPANDKNETSAIKSALGERALQIPVSSTKSMTGHLLGGSGGIEAVAAVLALQNGVVPPTINHQYPDPACDLDVVPNQAREQIISTALSNSFGFGGHNVCLAFRRYA